MLCSGEVKRRCGLRWKRCQITLQRNKLILEYHTHSTEIVLNTSSRVFIVSRFWKKVVAVHTKNRVYYFKFPPSARFLWLLAIRNETFFNPHISMQDFQCLAVLGRGVFGKVRLARHIVTGEVLAIKSVHKHSLISSDRVHLILAEREILERISHPFIVQLKYAFHNVVKFYLATEYLPGGDLLGLLQREGRVPLSDAKLYIAEIGLALSYLHKKGIVYRDLKPANVLIDADGHLKLADFGFAKEIKQDSTGTFCGTIDFMAPEIVQSKSYSYGVDSWALGVLGYQLIFGESPFYDANRERMFSRIVSLRPDFPLDADSGTVDFLQKLLIKNPKHRHSFDTVKSHRFFDGMTMDDVLQKRINPTFVPHLSSPMSTEFFDSDVTREPALDSIGSIGDHEQMFEGFDFMGGYSSDSTA
jgi:serine/threonine protein kinase